MLPSDPTPAPAVISPVGFSSTVMSIIFRSFSDPVFTLDLTSEKIPLALNSESDWSSFNLLKGSPSSSNNSALITSSLVTVLPNILTLSTVFFSPSKIFILSSIPSVDTISFTECWTNCKSFEFIMTSNSSRIDFTLNGE